jgi:hypothetical protein
MFSRNASSPAEIITTCPNDNRLKMLRLGRFAPLGVEAIRPAVSVLTIPFTPDVGLMASQSRPNFDCMVHSFVKMSYTFLAVYKPLYLEGTTSIRG